MKERARRLMGRHGDLTLFALATQVGRDGTTVRAEALELVHGGIEDATLVGISVRWVRQDGRACSAELWVVRPLTSSSPCVLLDDADLARLGQAGGDHALHTEDGLRHVTLTVLKADALEQLTFTYENWGNATPHLAVEVHP